MKPTGKFNPITGEEIMQIEFNDIDFWHKDWDELTDIEKTTYMSYKGIQFLGDSNRDLVKLQFINDQFHFYF